jgi:hypothetical protein
MQNDEDIKKLLDKVKSVEKGEKLDLSSGEDLSVGVMNLIAIEEHLFFSYGKTKDPKYVMLLSEIREMRKKLLKGLVKEYEGEEWCIMKHLLAGCMRIMEVGTKSLTKGNKKEAEEYFQMAYKLYEMFWGLNLKLFKSEEISKLDSYELEKSVKVEKDSTTNFMAKLGQVIKHAVDCCRE